MPDIKDLNFNFGDSIPVDVNDFSFTQQGDLTVPFNRLIKLSELDGNDQVRLVTEDKDIYFNGNPANGLQDDIVVEEIEIEVSLGDTPISIEKQTFKVFWKYTIVPGEPDPPYLPIEISLATQQTNFCDDLSLLETQTFYLKTDELTESEKDNVKNGGFIFGKNLYTEYKVFGQETYVKNLWNGLLSNNQQAYYALFPNATSYEDKKYYRIGQRNIGDGQFINQTSYYIASDTEQSCPQKPSVYLLEVFIAPNLEDGEDNQTEICNGGAFGSVLRQLKQVYVAENPNQPNFSIEGLNFYDFRGNLLPHNSFRIAGPSGITGRAFTVRIAEDIQDGAVPYHLLSFNQNGSVSASPPVRECKRAIPNTELSDCEILNGNIAPENPNASIFCNGRTYNWNGFVWVAKKPSTGTPRVEGPDGTRFR